MLYLERRYKMKEALKCFRSMVDEDTMMKSWNPKNKLNLYMSNLFTFYQVNLLQVEFLLVKTNCDLTCSQLAQYFEQIEKIVGKPISFYTDSLTTYKRKKMFEHKIAFITKGGQFYLPFLALHMYKEKEQKKVNNKKFSALTQYIYLYLLYKEEATFDVEELVHNLNITKMSVSRALKHLEEVGVVRHSISGKTKRKNLYERLDKKTFYQKGKDYLCNPIKETIYVKEISDKTNFKKSGLYALSQSTMLAHSKPEIWAISKNQINKLQLNIISKEKALEEHGMIIQVTNYDIQKLTNNDEIDPISLIYSLDEKDERIELAIEEMMEDKIWFMESNCLENT